MDDARWLWLYGACVVAALGWAVAVRMAARRPRLAEPPGPLDLEELAYVAGGEWRVAQTVIVRMIENGQVRVNRKGQLTAVGDLPRDPLDRKAHELIGPKEANASEAASRIEKLPEIREYGERMLARGYLITDAAVYRAQFRSAAVLYVLLAVGTVWWFIEDRPGGFPLWSLIATAVLAVAVHGRDLSHQTVHGYRAMDQEFPGVTGQVARHGVWSYPDKEVKDALLRGFYGIGEVTSTRRPPVRRRGGGGDGGSGCGGGCGGGG